jgi:hypothetical protein
MNNCTNQPPTYWSKYRTYGSCSGRAQQSSYICALDGHKLFLALQDVTPEMGPTTFLIGTHRAKNSLDDELLSQKPLPKVPRCNKGTPSCLMPGFCIVGRPTHLLKSPCVIQFVLSQSGSYGRFRISRIDASRLLWTIDIARCQQNALCEVVVPDSNHGQ